MKKRDKVWRHEIQELVERQLLVFAGDVNRTMEELDVSHYHVEAIRNEMVREGKLPGGNGLKCPPLDNPQHRISWLEQQLHDVKEELHKVRYIRSVSPRWDGASRPAYRTHNVAAE